MDRGKLDISRALQIDGWMKPRELEILAMFAARSKYILEIGCWKGRSTRAMADNTKGSIEVVDTFEGDPGEPLQRGQGDIRGEFEANLKDRIDEGQIFITQADSNHINLRNHFGCYNFIFLDGSHEYEQVRIDIRNCRKLLSHYGILAGHDATFSKPNCGHESVTNAIRDELDGEEVGCFMGTGIWTWRRNQ